MTEQAEILDGVAIIEYQQLVDERGFFQRHFSRDRMELAGLNPHVEQANLSFNRTKHTLRGFHFQDEPHAEAKTISVLGGELLFQVIDLDPASSTHLKHMQVRLTAFGASAHIPKLKATAFLTLTDDVLVHYFMSSAFVPGAAAGIRYDDPYFSVRWPYRPSVIAERDLGWPLWGASR